MTAFQFMTTAFFTLAGVICLALAAVIIYSVAAYLYRTFTKGGGGHE